MPVTIFGVGFPLPDLQREIQIIPFVELIPFRVFWLHIDITIIDILLCVPRNFGDRRDISYRNLRCWYLDCNPGYILVII